MEDKMKIADIKPGDIVYLIQSVRRSPGPDYPCLDSHWECDLKVLEVHEDVAILITAQGSQIKVSRTHIVPARDRDKHRQAPKFISIVATELFPIDTHFFLNVEQYYCNENLGIYIGKERMPDGILKPFNP